MANKKLRTNHLLAIGIDRYQYDIPELENAVSDAKAFVKLLHEQYQFTPKNTITLYNKEATKDNILSKFDYLIDKLTKEDTLTIYYSGHGEFKERTKRGYWLPVEAKLNKRGTYLSNNEVTDFLRALDAFHVFTVVDACFSGALFRKVSSNQTRLDNFQSRWLLTAGRNEPVLDGFESSPFAESLLSYLENTTSEFTAIAKLCYEIVEGVKANTNETPRGEPLYNVGHQGGQFIFYKKGVTITATEVLGESPATNTKGIREEENTPEPSTPTLAEQPKPKDKTYKDLTDLKNKFKNEAIDLTKVFGLLNTAFKSDSHKSTDLIMLQSRYKQVEQQQRLGIASFDQINISTNQIRMATLNLIDHLEKEDVKANLFTSENQAIKNLEREGMNSREKLIVRKINILEDRLLIETDASVQFKLQHEIDEFKEKLEKLREE